MKNMYFVDRTIFFFIIQPRIIIIVNIIITVNNISLYNIISLFIYPAVRNFVLN